MSRTFRLSVESVSKSYGTRSLFDELSLGLFEGDRAGLVGPNGSGKSTLLRILAGLEAPDRGSRAVRGGVAIGYVPQDPVFAAGDTVEENARGAPPPGGERERAPPLPPPPAPPRLVHRRAHRPPPAPGRPQPPAPARRH